MATIDVGDAVRLTWEVRDLTGTLTNATVTLAVTDPSGSVTNPTVSNPSTGNYQADITATSAGTWTARWQASGAVTAVDTYTLTAGGGIASLADLKAELNITDTAQDPELLDCLASATDLVEFFCGPVTPKTVTETHWGSGRQSLVVLRQSPVVSVTTITPALTGDSTTYNPAVFALDGATGLLRANDSSTWTLPFTVTYQAGRSTVPAGLKKACVLIAAHLFSTQYGSSDYQIPADSDITQVPGSSYAVPNRALDLMRPYRLGPSVA